MTCEIFSEIAASEAKTRLFAANIIEFCEKWGFDGFDLDWATWADGLVCCWGRFLFEGQGVKQMFEGKNGGLGDFPQ